MNEEQEDFALKLLVVEQEAQRLAEDLPPGTMRSRAEHIVCTVSLLKARLGIFAPVIIPPTKKPERR